MCFQHALLAEWSLFCLGFESPSDEAVETFVSCMFKRYVIKNHADEDALGLAAVKYLRDVSDHYWKQETSVRFHIQSMYLGPHYMLV